MAPVFEWRGRARSGNREIAEQEAFATLLPMNTTRRSFLQSSSLLGTGLLAIPPALSAADSKPAAAIPGRTPRMKLGTVTYNLAKDWDVETLIKNCEATQFQGAELRTSHAHRVEVALNREERAAVRKRFADSKVELMGLGSAFDYHTPDQSKLKLDIAATKEYIKLAHDVGASGVKVRPNGFPKEVPPEKTLEQIGRSLRELGEFGDSHGVAIRLEVHGS